MTRKLMILVFLSTLVLAGCGGGAPAETPQPPAATTAAEPANDTLTAEETPDMVEATSEPETPSSTEATEEAAVESPADETATEEVTEAADPDQTTASVAEGTAIARVSFPSTAARSGPATTFDAVTQVSVNQEFPVIAMTGEGPNVWYLVDLGAGQTGWLWARVVTIVPEDAEIEVAATVPAP